MITLTAIQDYFERKQLATVSQLAKEFGASAALVEHMLMFFLRKQQVKIMEKSTCTSGTCGGCTVTCDPVYCWCSTR